MHTREYVRLLLKQKTFPTNQSLQKRSSKSAINIQQRPLIRL